jgi:hypothetical protein
MLRVSLVLYLRSGLLAHRGLVSWRLSLHRWFANGSIFNTAAWCCRLPGTSPRSRAAYTVRMFCYTCCRYGTLVTRRRAIRISRAAWFGGLPFLYAVMVVGFERTTQPFYLPA